MLRNAVSEQASNLIASLSTLGNSAEFVDAEFSLDDAPPKLFAAGSDYVRLTCKDADASAELADRMGALGRRFLDEGNYLDEKAYVLGYRGWSCGPVFFGERPDGVMVQGSSVGSDLVVTVAQGLPVHPTRVDLQVTLEYPDDRRDVGRLVADQHQAWRLSEQASGWMVPRPPRLIDGYGAGDSCLIGARSSEGFGRAYDKHREACEKYRDRVNRFRERMGVYPLGTWRQEVEFKGSQAEQVYERLSGSESYSGVAVGMVKRWFEDRGVLVPVAADALSPVKTIKHKSDVERSLAWIRDQVHPTVVKLIDLGYRAEVLHALGLGNHEGARPDIDTDA